MVSCLENPSSTVRRKSCISCCQDSWGVRGGSEKSFLGYIAGHTAINSVFHRNSNRMEPSNGITGTSPPPSLSPLHLRAAPIWRRTAWCQSSTLPEQLAVEPLEPKRAAEKVRITGHWIGLMTKRYRKECIM